MQDDNAKLLSDMVKIRSISSHEEEMIEFNAEQFGNSGANVIIDPMGNLVATFGDGIPIIAIDAHIDTVNTGDVNLWDKNPFSGEIADGNVYGRGASDQKGGAAAMVTASRIIKELGLTIQGTVMFTCTVQEEDCDGLCWRYIIEEDKIKPDVVILTEPTDGKINRGQRGRMEMQLRSAGISSHGSAPERGDNAIYKLARMLLEIEQLNERLRSDNFLGKGTITATKLYSSSPSLCAVADGAAVHLDRRLTAGETSESAVEEILNLPSVKQNSGNVKICEYSQPGWRGLVYKSDIYFPSWALDEKHPYLITAVQCYSGLFGQNPVIDKWTFSTNGVSTMGIHKIPSFGFGPGFEHQAHAPNEYCPIEHLTNCAAFYAAYAASFVSQ
jgi:putative selenium metabolism hydrolase